MCIITHYWQWNNYHNRCLTETIENAKAKDQKFCADTYWNLQVLTDMVSSQSLTVRWEALPISASLPPERLQTDVERIENCFKGWFSEKFHPGLPNQSCKCNWKVKSNRQKGLLRVSKLKLIETCGFLIINNSKYSSSIGA